MTKPSSTEVAVQEANAAALAASDQAAAEVAAAQAQEFDDSLLAVPYIKIGQGLTREVQDGNAAQGEFISTLTNEGLGDVIKFIIAYYNTGRFASEPKTNRAFVTTDDTIPASWEDLVGAEFVGTPFSEYSEAEETYKAAVNAKQREWGSGPLVSTTHNYTGLVLVEGEDDAIEYQPVRLSLKRIEIPAVRKLNTLQRAVLRNKPAWDAVIRLSTVRKEFGRNAAYVINPSDVRIVRKTTAEEKLQASELALAVMHGRTQATGDETDAPVEPADAGGLAV